MDIEERIARAVADERERCANIAENAEIEVPGYFERLEDPCNAVASYAGEVIASIIRAGGSNG